MTLSELIKELNDGLERGYFTPDMPVVMSDDGERGYDDPIVRKNSNQHNGYCTPRVEIIQGDWKFHDGIRSDRCVLLINSESNW